MPDEELKTELCRQLESEIRKQKRKIKQMEKGQQECSTWKQVFHEGELLKAHYGQLKRNLPAIRLVDWETNQEIELRLDPKKSPQDQLKARFKKAKKLETGISRLTDLLQQANQELSAMEEKLMRLESTEDLAEYQTPKKAPAAKLPPEKSLPYKEFTSKSGIRIWVGKSARANDKLTFTYANGSDWWLHVQGFSGSHVVIKSAAPDSETVQEAMQLALRYSKAAKGGEAEVCITQRKYLTRFPRQPGKVQVAKHKTYFVRSN